MFSQSLISYVKGLMYSSKPKVVNSNYSTEVAVNEDIFLSPKEILMDDTVVTIGLEDASKKKKKNKTNTPVVFYTRWPMESKSFIEVVREESNSKSNRNCDSVSAKSSCVRHGRDLYKDKYNFFEPIEPPVVSVITQSEIEDQGLLGKDLIRERGVVVLLNSTDLVLNLNGGDKLKFDSTLCTMDSEETTESSDTQDVLDKIEQSSQPEENDDKLDAIERLKEVEQEESLLDTIENLLKKEKLTHKGADDGELADKSTKLGPSIPTTV